MTTVTLAKPKRKPAPPQRAATVANLTKPASGQNVPLQVKIPPEVRAGFKSYAAARDLDASELFLMAWDYYRSNHA